MSILRFVLASIVAIAGLQSGCSAPPIAAASPAGKSITAALQPFVDSQTLAGAVTLVATKDRVLSLATVGYADVAAKQPMRPDTLFWIASMTKPITATALMMLVDEGKVKLDDPVEKYVPEFRAQWVAVEADKEHVLLKPAERPVTVRMLLAHTSGLPFLPQGMPKIDRHPTASMALVGGLVPLNAQPGAKYAYSNVGIDTAGRVIEVASAMPYEEFVQRRLLDPLGMKDTTFWPTEEQMTRLAKSYKAGPGNRGLEETTIPYLTYPLTDRRRVAEPGGGLFSTAADVARFGQMILNGGVWAGKRYLSEAAVAEMTSIQTGTVPAGPGRADYGLGWATNRKLPAPGTPGASAGGAPGMPAAGSGVWFGHGGAFGTDLRIDADRGLVIVYLVQHASAPPSPDGRKPQAVFGEAAKAAYGK